MKIVCRKDRDGRLSPATAEAIEVLQKIKAGKYVWVNVLQARNGGHHRKYFAMLRLVFDNLPEHLKSSFPTEERLRKELIVQTGRFDLHQMLKPINGLESMIVPNSIAYQKMSQGEFDRLYTDTIHVVRDLVAIDDYDLQEMVHAFL